MEAGEAAVGGSCLRVISQAGAGMKGAKPAGEEEEEERAPMTLTAPRCSSAVEEAEAVERPRPHMAKAMARRRWHRN